MLGESMTTIPSLWTSIYSWLTPTVLFVFLNLMIGTIAITSSLTARKPNEENQHQHQQQQNRQLGRSPSVLQRLKSINLYSYKPQEPVFAYEKSPEINTHFSFQQTPEQQNHPYEQPSYFSRSPSMINRLKSFNLYNYISQEPVSPLPANSPQTEQTEPIRYDADVVHAPEESSPEPEEKEEAILEEEEQSLDEVYSKLKEAHVTRTKSDTKPASGEIPKKLPKKMRKSASTKSAFAHFEEDDIVEARRPATVKESKGKFAEEDEEDDDGEVDAKADDFINKFKHQLKLQRMDSILKYKNNIKKGGEK